MRTRCFVLLSCLMVLGASIQTANAAQAQITVNGVEYTLRTNTPGGQCLVLPLPDGSVDVDCDDGAGNRAYGNTVQGCFFASGSGQCVETPPPANAHATTDAECPNGNTFTITTGNDKGSCEIQHDGSGNTTGGRCDDGAGNSSSFNCSYNNGNGDCQGSSGSGKCTCKTCK